MDYFLGQLLLVGFSFAPKNFALCNGQLLPIAQNQALFSLLGNTYGGNGQTTFGLPNLQGRVALSGGSNFTLGTVAGAESVTLLTAQIPAHVHTLSVSTSTGPLITTVDGNTTGTSTNDTPYANSSSGMMSTGLLNAGSGQPHENRSPYLTLNWVIALVGIYPTRS